MKYNYKFGKWLKQERKKAGLTQLVLSSILGYKHNKIQQIETGLSKNITINLIRELLQAMPHLSYEDMLKQSGIKNNTKNIGFNIKNNEI